jgi:hypothetical protein
MELSWLNKIRVGLVAALGIVVIGIFCWPLVAPQDPMAPVRCTSVGLSGTLVLWVAAFAVGAVAYAISWPHGREMGILAVPFGLCLWGLRTGPMAVLYQAANTAPKRSAVLNSLLLEPLYWLAIVAAGFAGVLVMQRIAQKSKPDAHADEMAKAKSVLSSKMATTVLVAVMLSVIVAQFFLSATARDIPPFDNVVATQPPSGQIAFAVIVAFAAAAFVVKQFIGLSYVLPTIAAAFIVPFAQIAYSRGGRLDSALMQPATFFNNSTLAVLPLQLVAFGAVGSVIGYWMAIRYRYWRTHPTD